MLSDLEIYRAAQATISRYGDEADLHAAMRAVELMAAGDVKRRAVWHRIERVIDELLAEGDMGGRAVWPRVESAIDELQRTAPGEGEGVH